jgi:hypothetical protein
VAPGAPPPQGFNVLRRSSTVRAGCGCGGWNR